MASAVATKKTESSKSISVKQAVGAALNYFAEMLPQLAKERVMLEEVEESEDGRQFLITIGYDVPRARGSIKQVMGDPMERNYKTIGIDARTGKPLSMRIRTI